MKLDGQYLLSLKLYETESGTLLSADETEATRTLELIHNVRPLTKRLIKKGLGIGSAGLREGNFSGSLEDQLDVGSDKKASFDSNLPRLGQRSWLMVYWCVQAHPARRKCRLECRP